MGHPRHGMRACRGTSSDIAYTDMAIRCTRLSICLDLFIHRLIDADDLVNVEITIWLAEVTPSLLNVFQDSLPLILIVPDSIRQTATLDICQHPSNDSVDSAECGHSAVRGICGTQSRKSCRDKIWTPRHELIDTAANLRLRSACCSRCTMRLYMPKCGAARPSNPRRGRPQAGQYHS